MGRSWATVSVVAIALVALGGCNDRDDEVRKYCSLFPTPGVRLTVKGTAEYTTEVTGDAVVNGITYYSAGAMSVSVQDPEQPFSATVELDVGDLFQSSTGGFVVNGSITARDVFTPADGSGITVNEATCTGD